MALVTIACAVLSLALFWWVFTAVPDDAGLDARGIQEQALLERKKAVYDNLKDLHFEHLAGKLSDTDFERTRLMLEREAAAVIHSLDHLTS